MKHQAQAGGRCMSSDLDLAAAVEATGVCPSSVIEISPPLDRQLPVVGRGWLTVHEGVSFLVHSRTERAYAGIRTSLPPTQEVGVRYTLHGKLGPDDTFEVQHMERSSLQNPPDIGFRELRSLGCAGRTPLSVIQDINARLGETIYDRLAVSVIGESTLSPENPEVKVLFGELTIVRWMTAELRSWLIDAPVPNTFIAYPILANDKADLLPW